MEFITLAEYFEKLEQTSSRLEMTALLQELLTKLKANEVRLVLYMAVGRVAPKYQPIEFNMAEQLVIKAIAKAYGNDIDTVRGHYKELGDLGLVAASFAKKNSIQKTSIHEVYSSLRKIADIGGEGSQAEKVKLLATTLSSAPAIVAKYIVRIVLNTLRLGFGDKTIIDALSWTQTKDKSGSEEIERAYAVSSDLGIVGEIVLEKGIKGLIKLGVTPGRPMASQLSQRESNIKAIFKRLGSCAAQPKLDGLRGQIHKWQQGGKTQVAIYSRNQETLTHMFPEIVERAKKLPAKSFVIDSEIIGYLPETDEFYRFQETITRRRKHDVKEHSTNVPVTAFAFDIMYLNDKDLTTLPYESRLKNLDRLFSVGAQSTILKAETSIAQDEKILEQLFDKYVSLGLEGIMCKSLTHNYMPGARNYDWIKFKRASHTDLVDTIDAVALGYYKGRGKNARFGIGALLLGIYDEKADKIETIAKVGSGFREDTMPKMKATLDKLATKRIPPRVEIDKALIPDIIVEPKIICVIRADEITRSPIHTAGRDRKDAKGTGFALRFPRIIEFNRKDLSGAESATKLTEIEDLYKKAGAGKH